MGDSVFLRRLTMREKTLLLSALVLLVGSASAMPGDIEEEGFCIDGDVVAGFCLGANYAEKVQTTEGTCRTFCEEFLDMTETGHNMDENNVPENCMEASADADYRDFFNFYADQAGRRYYTEEMLENAYNRLSEEDKTKLNGVVSQMSFHECIKEEWSRECERTVNRFVANAAMPAGR